MTYANFVGGKWVASDSAATLENRNPANTNDLVGLFPDSSPKDVEGAIAAAKHSSELASKTPGANGYVRLNADLISSLSK